jgi:hypothetical protein
VVLTDIGQSARQGFGLGMGASRCHGGISTSNDWDYLPATHVGTYLQDKVGALPISPLMPASRLSV